MLARRLWSVSTEGDCEGRTVHNLGTHEGFLDDVALGLATEAYYALDLAPVEPDTRRLVDSGSSVHVRLPISTGTWGDHPHRLSYFRELLAGRPVEVEESIYFACVRLRRAESAEASLARRRAAALAKLSPEEIALLGIKVSPDHV